MSSTSCASSTPGRAPRRSLPLSGFATRAVTAAGLRQAEKEAVRGAVRRRDTHPTPVALDDPADEDEPEAGAPRAASAVAAPDGLEHPPALLLRDRWPGAVDGERP